MREPAHPAWRRRELRRHVLAGSRILALTVTLGGLLAVIGVAAWLLATSPAINAASVVAFGCLVVLVPAAATVLIRPRHL